MPKTSQLSTSSNHFLIDTCIAEYLLDNAMSKAVKDQLSIWTASVFNLAISEISYAELTNGAYKEKVERIKELLEKYMNVAVSKRVLIGAGILSNMYRACNPKTNGASLQDKIIATTAFIYNLPVITADIQDFPHPFFTTLLSENVEYTKKKKKHLITVDVLKPNVPLLNYCYTKVQ